MKFTVSIFFKIMIISIVTHHYIHPNIHPSTLYNNDTPKITVIGSGYVGLVTGAGLSKQGNTVICADIDTNKINSLNQGIIPIYEPGLQELVLENIQNNTLSFTDNIEAAIKQADIIFIAVGTPMGDDGSADLAAIKAVTGAIAKNLNSFKIIVTKSTVPVGTGAWINQMMLDQGIAADQFAIVSNPEFLKEGSAVEDFLYPDRIVVGSESEKAHAAMRTVYANFLAQGTPYVTTNVVTAESIKYASNAFLATKISFINEVANLCDATGADVQELAHGMGLDRRINRYFLNPGPGFGGSCFPKDTEAFLYTSKQYGLNLYMVEAALKANKLQKLVPFKKLLPLMNNDLQNKTIAVLGLAFKANTDDIRYSPAISTIQQLLDHGAQVKAYDPQAMKSMLWEFPHITYCASIDEAVQNADAVMIMTEWDEFKTMDLAHIGSLLKQRVLVDARNIIDPAQLHQHGFIGDDIGRSCLCKVKQLS